MKYSISLPTVEDQFANCWNVVVDKLRNRGRSDGPEVVKAFKKEYDITLIYCQDGGPVGKLQWGWSHLIFKSKSAYILWMLEWS